MGYYPEFAKLLGEYLTQAERSQAWLARKLDLDRSNVTRWLKGETRPDSPEKVDRIADLLGIRTQDERIKFMQATGYAYQTPFVDDNNTTANERPDKLPKNIIDLNIDDISKTDTPPTRQQRHRQFLINLIKRKVEQQLQQSLYQGVFIPLALEEKPNFADNHSGNRMLQFAQRSDRILDAKTNIVDIFAELNQSLLILGEPGSGKTRLSLELASDLIQRAENDPLQPVPVLFNLSSWSIRRSSLTEWLSEEFNRIHNISSEIANLWIEQDALILFLDGFDEVKTEHQAECVEAINTFLARHLVPVVVCSRIIEYEMLTIRLKLQGAISIKPLTLTQARTFFDEVGSDLKAVKDLLQEDNIDNPLREIVTSPLMLNIIALAYQGESQVDLSLFASPELQRKSIFDTYTEQMFHLELNQPDRPVNQIFSRRKTDLWLTYLARKMKQQSQSTFRLDQIQPDWLPTQTWRMRYVLLSRLVVGLLGGLAGGLAFGFSFGLVYGQTADLSLKMGEGLLRGLVEGLTGGLIGGLTVGIIDSRRLDQVAAKSFRQRVADVVLLWLGIDLSVGVSFGLLFGLSNWLDKGFIFWLWQEGLLNVGLLIGLSLGVLFGLKPKASASISGGDIQTAEYLRWGADAEAKQKAKQGAFYGFMIGFVCSLIVIFNNNQLPDLIRHAEIDQPNSAVITMLIISLTLAVVGAIFGGTDRTLPQSEQERKSYSQPGVRFWFNNGGKVGVQVGLSIGLVGIIVGSLIGGQHPAYGLFDFVRVAIVGLFYGLFFGLLAAFWYGGLDAIKHYTLRFLLYRLGYIPWRYQTFLDYCAQRTFLLKVGSGYIFIHRLLLDYFAALSIKGNEHSKSPNN